MAWSCLSRNHQHLCGNEPGSEGQGFGDVRNWGTKIKKTLARGSGVDDLFALALATNICGVGLGPHSAMPWVCQFAATYFQRPHNALGSSEVDSQFGDSLQLRVRKVELWFKQRDLRLDLLELLPSHCAVPTPATQHFAPIAFYERRVEIREVRSYGNSKYPDVSFVFMKKISNSFQRMSSAGMSALPRKTVAAFDPRSEKRS